MAYEKYKVNLEPGESGIWRLVKFTVTEEDEKHERMRVWSNRGRWVPAGDYTALYRNSTIVMSDTPDEIRDHIEFIYQAKGHVLINGLGLGMCAKAAANKDEVLSVTVIEASEDVINLVAHQLDNPKITVIHSDAYTWAPPHGVVYDVVWHDIWDNLCTDNLEEMTKLHRKYGRRSVWQGSWGKEYLKSKQREEKRNRWW